MNSALRIVKDWFLMKTLNLNPSKTRYMIFNHKTNRTVDNTQIMRVWDKGTEKSFKLVGIHIDKKLKWRGTHHIHQEESIECNIRTNQIKLRIRQTQ